jgi:DNA/RNA-binding domain of Phe-tRNA-synthetase-like protein
MENIHNNPSQIFEEAKRNLEISIRDTYQKATRKELKEIYPLNAYVAYYKKFGSTYHVLLQLESVAKGKPIQNKLPIVEAMFMSELKTLLLTAVHDFDKIILPLSLKKSSGTESFISLNGSKVTVNKNDLYITDKENIISSFIRGADHRTAVTPLTTKALFTTYAPSEIEDTLIYQNLSDIESFVRIFSPQANTLQKEVIIS